MIDERLFINRLYDESMTLLIEARNYFQFNDAAVKPAIDQPQPHDKIFVKVQAMRFTSRMTQTMAWLLAQRAIYSGEMTPNEACSGNFSLGGESICTDNDGHHDERLSSGLQSLLERSHSLYHRVWRLDQNAQRRIEQGMMQVPPSQMQH